MPSVAAQRRRYARSSLPRWTPRRPSTSPHWRSDISPPSRNHSSQGLHLVHAQLGDQIGIVGESNHAMNDAGHGAANQVFDAEALEGPRYLEGRARSWIRRESLVCALVAADRHGSGAVGSRARIGFSLPQRDPVRTARQIGSEQQVRQPPADLRAGSTWMAQAQPGCRQLNRLPSQPSGHGQLLRRRGIPIAREQHRLDAGIVIRVKLAPRGELPGHAVAI